MPSKRHDLHGNVPDNSPVCLLIVDMINPLTFPGATRMLPDVLRAARRIAALKRRLKRRRVPVVYVNDNFGKWRSDFRKLVARCLETECRGRRVAGWLQPAEDDYFVLKPKHSGFYATPLELLLQFLGARELIVTGIAANSCVLHTAADAYMRDFTIRVPADCTASLTRAQNRAALKHMRTMFKADVRASDTVRARSSGRTRR
jgi:nicotinamidase-related amidase